MIHYHGGPVWPKEASVALWHRRHAFVSFAHPDQIATAADICQSFALDNGAFSHWKAGKGIIDVAAYAEWVREWMRHPAFDFAVIPDVIDGSEQDNQMMRATWLGREKMPVSVSVPVWHLHESLEELKYLCTAYPRVAFGSSGAFADVGTDAWWQRMGEAMDYICDENGRPPCKLHGLRMLDPTVFSQLPLSSADSTNIAANIGKDVRWKGSYQPMTREVRSLVLADRIEYHAAAARWVRTFGVQKNFELVG